MNVQEGEAVNDIPPSRDRDLPPGRHRVLREQLMREIRSEPAGAPKTWRRPAFVAPAVAAALSVAVVVGVTVTRDSAAPPRPETAMTQTPSTQSAARLLERIARAAEKRQLPDIRDDQFVYTKRESYHWKMDPDKTLPEGCASTSEAYDYGVRELWESVDGRHVGLSREHRDNGRTVERPIAHQLPGKRMPNYYRQAEELPTDPEAMYRWLTQARQGRSGDEMAGFQTAARLLDDSLLPPRTQAALYRALARIPGLTVVEGAEDVAGRAGVGVMMKVTQGNRAVLVFDAQSLAYLGDSTIDHSAPKNKCDGTDIGDVVSATAVLDREVVNKAGQRP
ncbi:CU044_5270 family protein [Streptomyces sp. NPDC002896]|uniref:CU044_5270 family protein n=1 Tax=Streptomyces sp. NPDC002896 TaxID=3154438 RepID=UPI00332358E9